MSDKKSKELIKEVESVLKSVNLDGYGFFPHDQYNEKLIRLNGMFEAIIAASPNPRVLKIEFEHVITIMRSHHSLAAGITEYRIGYLDKD